MSGLVQDITDPLIQTLSRSGCSFYCLLLKFRWYADIELAGKLLARIYPTLLAGFQKDLKEGRTFLM